MGDKNRGLYRKYRVERTDGRSAPGEKHHECKYFVLDILHDEYAKHALHAYAKACRKEYPVLAEDLDGIVSSLGLTIPDRATKLNAKVYLSSSGKQLVVLGDPDVLGLPEEWHNCDYMGCGQEHVIARPSVTGDDWRDEDMQLILSLLDELLGRCIVLKDDGNNDADNEVHSLVQGLLLGTADLNHARDRLKELRGE